jgi:hypothetical protein
VLSDTDDEENSAPTPAEATTRQAPVRSSFWSGLLGQIKKMGAEGWISSLLYLLTFLALVPAFLWSILTDFWVILVYRRRKRENAQETIRVGYSGVHP